MTKRKEKKEIWPLWGRYRIENLVKQGRFAYPAWIDVTNTLSPIFIVTSRFCGYCSLSNM